MQRTPSSPPAKFDGSSKESFVESLRTMDIVSRGSILRKLRVMRGHTQASLGELLGKTGSLCSNVERGLQNGTRQFMERLYEEYREILTSFAMMEEGPLTPTMECPINERSFLQLQKELLQGSPHTIFAFLESASLTTFLTEDVLTAWIDRLNEGHKLRIFLSLDSVEISALQHLLLRVRMLESGIVSKKTQEDVPVCVQAVRLASKTEPDELESLFREYAENHKHLSPTILNIGAQDLAAFTWSPGITTRIVHCPYTKSLEHFPWAALRFDELGALGKGSPIDGAHYIAFGPSAKLSLASNTMVAAYDRK